MSEWDFLWDIEGDELLDAMATGATRDEWDYIEEMERKIYGIDEDDLFDSCAMVLIDAESVSYTYAASIENELSSIGNINEVRYYAIQNDPVTAGWKDTIKRYGYKPILMAGGPEKNKIDNKIIKDAKRFCNSEDGIDVIVLVSRDGDYAELVKYLRSSQKKVIILGPKNTSKKLKNASNESRLISNKKRH